MKRIFISALALLGMGTMATEADAQMYIIKDGKVKVALDYIPDYITFENPMLCGGVIGEPVDLGLSVKWSSVNIGASSPEQSGNHYAWGETETKDNYSWDTYKLGGTFIGDNKTTLDPEDDAAHVNWGGDWGMPSPVDFDELQRYCTRTWTTQNGVNGYLFKASNGNSIFLPAAGRNGGDFEGSNGFYWSSSLTEYYSRYGHILYFNGGNLYGDWSMDFSRCYGYSVRPVCPSAGDTNGHVGVDLGLPSGKLWADCNVGASTPEASGDYIAWGEIEAKSDYSWSTYKYMQSGKSEWYYINKYQADDHQLDGSWYKDVKYYQGDKKTTLEAKDDVATQSWGSEWRMPTAAEWGELYNECYWVWTNGYNGTSVPGYIVYKAKDAGDKGIIVYDGNTPSSSYSLSDIHIFLPWVTDLFDDGGYYWSSSLNEYDTDSASDLRFEPYYFGPWNVDSRFRGQSVRPVCPSAE